MGLKITHSEITAASPRGQEYNACPFIPAAPPPQPSIPDGDATAESSPPDPIDGDDQDIGIRTVRPVIDANELNPFSSASSLCK